MANKKNRTTEPAKTRVELMPEDNEDIITLEDDDGNEVDFYQVACVEYENEFYALLQPAEELEGVDDDEALIFKLVEEDDENDLFMPVDDPELLDKIFNEYVKATADAEEEESGNPEA